MAKTEEQKANLIYGKVVDKFNRPLANLIVQVYDREMRSEVLLGECITSRSGKYEIYWSQIQVSDKSKNGADIIVKVYTKENKSLLYSSGTESVRFRASAREEINIIITADIKPETVEYDYLLGLVKKYAGNIPITDLQDSEEQRDITFIENQADIPFEKIEYIVIANRLTALSKIDAPFFYALLCKNTLLKNDFIKSFHARLNIDIFTDIQSLLYDVALADPGDIQADVDSAVREMLVTSRVAKELKNNLEKLKQFKSDAEKYYKDLHPRQVLNIISRFLLENKIEEVNRLLEENKNDPAVFMRKLSDNSLFSGETNEAQAKATLALGELLGFDDHIVTQVSEIQKITKPADVKNLAKLNKAGWSEVLTKASEKITITGKTIDKELIDLHASSLVRKMEKEFPTTAFTAQLEREEKPIFKKQKEITTFLSKYDDFDLQNNNIDLFIKEKKIPKEQGDAVREELKSVQRIFKLTPNYSKTNALLKEKIHSAQSIVAVGETRFINEIAPKAGIDKKEAKSIFKKAEKKNIAAMLIVGELQDTIKTMGVPALKKKSLALKLKAVSNDFPNLKTLFNLTDTCTCEHCRSVYSPAAYLVELLQFLDKRSVIDTETNTPGRCAKDVLFTRRPDLGEIDLGCENANIPVKYIDLVCELLEEAVAPDGGINYTGILSEGTDPLQGKISTTLFDELTKQEYYNKYPVTKEAMIYKSEIISPVTYYLRDKKVVCKIIVNADGSHKIIKLRQTLSTAEELAAAPEYVNDKAYTELKNSIFAFKLPFDLDHVEAKAYFSRFGISRAKLMEDFQVNGNPDDKSIAAEYLGLNNTDRILIVTSDSDNQNKYWNTNLDNASEEMKIVDTFLTETGLNYKDLELLLKLKFIKQNDNLFIKHLDTSCNTKQKEISNLNDIILDRIHRFLRLQKKTGIGFVILDEIISQKNLGNKNNTDNNSIILADESLIILTDLLKISELTGIKLDELIGFYGEIPHKILKYDIENPLYYKVFLNKAKNGYIDEALLPEMIDGSQLLSEFKTSLSVCLQLSEQDFEKITLAENLITFGIAADSPPLFSVNNPDKFSNLSYLFAVSRLLKKLKIKIDDIIVYTELTGLNIFQAPKNTLAFIDYINESKQLPLKPADLVFNLNHKAGNLSEREIKAERIKQILEKLQGDYQNNFSVNKSLFDNNLSAEEQKGILKNALSKLNGLGEEDINIIVGYIDNVWTLMSDFHSFVDKKLSTIFTASQNLNIKNCINNLETAAGPDYSSEKSALINLLCQTIDPEIDLSFLSEAEKIKKLKELLLSYNTITPIETDSLIKYIELNIESEKSFIDDKLGSSLSTGEIKTALDKLRPNALEKYKAVSKYESALSVYRNAAIELDEAKTLANEAEAETQAKIDADAQIVIKEANLVTEKSNLTNASLDLESKNANFELKKKELIKAFLNSTSAYQLQLSKQSILVQTISSFFNADLELVKVVLSFARLKQPAAGNRLLSDILITDTLIDTNVLNTNPVFPVITETAFAEQYSAIRLLHKLFPFINSFNLENSEIEWYFKYNKDLNWLEWDSIPYKEGQTAIEYTKYLAFIEMVSLSKKLTPVSNPADTEHPVTFFSVIEMILHGSTSTRDEFFEKYSLLTGYEKEEIMQIDSYLFNIWDVRNYRKVTTWHKLEKYIEYLKKLGSTLARVVEYIKPELTNTDISLLRTALKARYDEETWLITLKEIMDVIRPQKRDALIAYLLAENPEMKDENDLYDYFLVDVEMESCMPSSRIVQAHGAIQLFVQRCLMGLEPKSAADLDNDKNWEQWKWMKNYRVWEANRKVFLYPENWIEAELRDDKSFLFTELENELLQNELTEFTAEEAFIKYLEKLDNIAFLEVMATWYQSDIKTMHVFARTKGGDPAIYYYRKFEQERYWTPWEKVDLDITGDHLLAFVRNNRLYLAWPVFSEEPKPEIDSKVPTNAQQGTDIPSEKPLRKLKIQLAISEYANKKWQTKKISKDGIMTPSKYTSFEKYLKKDIFNLMYFEHTQQIWLFSSNISEFSFMVSPKSYSTKNSNQKDDTKGKSSSRYENYKINGIFNLNGCKGYPELASPCNLDLPDFLPDFKDTLLASQRYNEINQIPNDELSVRNGISFFDFYEILSTTPGNFRLTYPHQVTKIDLVSLLFQYLLIHINSKDKLSLRNKSVKFPFGTLLSYFMEDSRHSYAIIPGFYKTDSDTSTCDKIIVKRTSSDILKLIEDIIALMDNFLNDFKNNPKQDVYEMIKKLVDNNDYQEIIKELKILNSLSYGEQFKNMYHPLICELRKTLYKDGVSELMKRKTQLQKTSFNFNSHYNPNSKIVPKTYTLENNGLNALSYPVEDIDFSTDGSYSCYNWELFFHVPFLIATRLTKNQRYEEALTWFHYMFNPTGALPGVLPQKYWVTKPFYLTNESDYINQRIDTLMYNIADPETPERAELVFAIEQWREKPFKPHVIARFRPVSYQKALLMKYIDNLTEWGDYLFRQDTMESIVQATQMYILADKLLGPKPRIIPPSVKIPYETYNQMEARIDDFGNALIEMENILPDLSEVSDENSESLPSPVTLSSIYFCIPQNDKMLEYWDRVADRLFKIRHCQNIDGVERSLALFAPPIDPGMLVRAAAAGLDITSILAGLNAPTPYYRFNVLSQKATELTQEVRGLGSSLLQALEKKDAEAMSLLRSDLEIKVLNAVKDIKLLQINEAKEQIEILKRTKKVTDERFKFYSQIEKINRNEQLNMDKLSESHDFQVAAQGVKLAASIISLIPDIDLGVSGFGGSPIVKAKTGGMNFGQATNAASDILSFLGMLASNEAARASIRGGYDRRFDDWKLQERLAKLELDSIEKQIVAAEIRKEISETDLKNHELQIENAKKTDDFMRSKFTNKELYDWMIGQISSVYFRSYQLAHDFAKKAERCYRFELGNDDTFISYGYWDSMKKGLQSADQLINDIKRMETSYLDKNKREYEITKHVSLLMLDPLALIRLKSTGVCDFEIPEVLYDMDHTGHYFRRIKSVSISIPCIAGPYTSVNAKLSLINNRYRKNTNQNPQYTEEQGNDERFVYNVGAIQSIATSNAQNDSGVFELNFRDERYLPFEGTGAISSWRLELPNGIRQFDYNTISDVIIHIKYTAREGGSTLRRLVESSLVDQMALISQQLNESGLHIALNMKHDFPNEWNLLTKNKLVDFKIDKSRLPYFTQSMTTNIEHIMFVAKVKKDENKELPSIYNMKISNTSVVLNLINDWELHTSIINNIALDTSLNIETFDDLLEELMIVVKYSF